MKVTKRGRDDVLKPAAETSTGLIDHAVCFQRHHVPIRQTEAIQNVELLGHPDVLRCHCNVVEDTVARVGGNAGFEEIVVDLPVAVVNNHGSIGSKALLEVVG